jgi:hypothetical protein
MLVWAFANQRHMHPALFQAALGRAEALLDQMSLQVGSGGSLGCCLELGR